MDDYDIDNGAIILNVYSTPEAAYAYAEIYAEEYNKDIDNLSVNAWVVR
jgi:predicted nucleotidyltransferase